MTPPFATRLTSRHRGTASAVDNRLQTTSAKKRPGVMLVRAAMTTSRGQSSNDKGPHVGGPPCHFSCWSEARLVPRDWWYLRRKLGHRGQPATAPQFFVNCS